MTPMPPTTPATQPPATPHVTNSPEAAPAAPTAGPGAALTLVMAAGCGLMVANLYYAQPLAGPIARDLGLTPALTGLVVTLTQIGYGLGLLLIVPLADLIENRRLITTMLAVACAALLAAALSAGPAEFLAAALAIGLGSCAAQMIVPFSAALAPAETRGRTVGYVTSGLMLGIMLARPLASLIAEFAFWRLVYWLSAAAMIALGIVLRRSLPQMRPAASMGYGALLRSMWDLVRTEPLLRRRAFYQACQFGAFTLFWTVTPLVLTGADYGLGQGWIAAFGLAGAAGALASPVAGRIADRGLGRVATRWGVGLVAAGFALTWLAPAGSGAALALFVLAAIAIDVGVTLTLIISQRALFTQRPEQRARMNGIFMASFFCAGAIGSALGAAAYAAGGWWLASALGAAAPLAALVVAMQDRAR